MPDKILAAARGEEYNSENSSSSENEEVTSKRRPKYKDVTTSEESNEESDAADLNEDSEEDSDDDETPLLQYSDKEMGQKGGPFTDADLYVTAKYIAAFTNWDDASARDRWNPYHEKVVYIDSQRGFFGGLIICFSILKGQPNRGQNTTVGTNGVCFYCL